MPNVPWSSHITASVIFGGPNVSLLCVTWQRFAVLVVIAMPDFANVPYALPFRRSSSQRRRLAAAYCSCRELHQPEKLFPDQIRQWPNIDRWKASRVHGRARVTRGSFILLFILDDWQPRFDVSCDSRGTRIFHLWNLGTNLITHYPCLARIKPWKGSRHFENGDITIRKKIVKKKLIASKFCK